MGSKFGLDYLINKNKVEEAASRQSQQPPAGADAEYVERATATLGREVLREVKRHKDAGLGPATLFGLVDVLQVDRDTLGLVVGRLESLGLVKVESEKYGNHAVQLTEIGEASLKERLPLE